MKKRHLLIGGLIIFAISRAFSSGEPRDAATLPRTTAVETSNTSSPPSGLTAPVSLPSEPPPKRADPAALASRPRDTQKPELPTPVASPETARRYVQGSGVAFRETPSSQGKILDRFDKGRRVGLVETGDGWSRVRDELTQKEGWVASRFLTMAVKQEEQPRSEANSPQKLPQLKVPVLPDTTIIQRIIANSLNSYSGSCACPYSTDRGGRKCGSRSAYSKPGGYAPVCYPQDVTAAMIEAFRRQ